MLQVKKILCRKLLLFCILRTKLLQGNKQQINNSSTNTSEKSKDIVLNGILSWMDLEK